MSCQLTLDAIPFISHLTLLKVMFVLPVCLIATVYPPGCNVPNSVCPSVTLPPEINAELKNNDPFL